MKHLLAVCCFIVLVTVGCNPPPTPPTNTPPTDTPPSDTTPPAVVSISPANRATGVKEDASIMITFSETMDQDATQAAYTSTDLPASAVTFSWNAENTVLTVKPNEILEYAAGEDSTIPALSYAFSLSGTAKDAAGNLLPPFTSSFSTLKLINSVLYGTTSLNLDGEVTSSGGANATAPVTRVGYLGDSIAHSFFSFKLTAIPPGVTEIDKATLHIYKEGFQGNPYRFSNLLFESVLFIELTARTYYGDGVVRKDDPRLFDSASAPPGYLSSDVTSMVERDLNFRDDWDNLSQYHLFFSQTNTGIGSAEYVAFTTSEGPEGKRPFLQITYLIP